MSRSTLRLLITLLVLAVFALPSGTLSQCEISPGEVKFEWHGQEYSINVIPSINGGDTGGSAGYDGSATFRMSQTFGIHEVQYVSGTNSRTIFVNFSEPGCYDLTEV